MSEPAENYVSQDIAGIFRVQALKVWGWTLAAVTLWVAVIVLAPVARENGWAAATPIYRFFSYICHQMPDRSLYFDGHPLAVCSRCFGVYFGLFSGLAVYPLWRRIDDAEPLPRIWLFLSMVPMAVDWSLGVFGIWENTHLSRFITGLVLGAACATFIMPAFVEIKRNRAFRRRAEA